jgi:hypothetical protein
MRSDPDSRLCQERDSSSIARGWKNVHQTKEIFEEISLRQFILSTPGEQDRFGLDSLAVLNFVRPLERNKNMY